MEHTQNYQLSQWSGEDFIRMEDFNGDNEKIDKALAELDRMTWNLAGVAAQLAVRAYISAGKNVTGIESLMVEPFLHTSGFKCSEGVTVANGSATITGQDTGTVTSPDRMINHRGWTRARVFVQTDMGSTGSKVEVWLNDQPAEQVYEHATPSTAAGEMGTMQEFAWTGKGGNSVKIQLKLTKGTGDSFSVFNYAVCVI